MNSHDTSYEDELNCPRPQIFEARIEKSRKLREIGNKFYQEGLISESIRFYERALYHCDFEEYIYTFDFKPDHRQQIIDCNQTLHLNLARCAYRRHQFRNVIASTSKIPKCFGDDTITSEEIMIKLHIINSKAYIALEEFDRAENELKKAINFCNEEKYEPYKRDVEALLAHAKRCLALEHKETSRVWKGTLGQKIEEEAVARRQLQSDGIISKSESNKKCDPKKLTVDDILLSVDTSSKHSWQQKVLQDMKGFIWYGLFVLVVVAVTYFLPFLLEFKWFRVLIGKSSIVDN
jgi:tetratricopeptide (TPR) repeat protein